MACYLIHFDEPIGNERHQAQHYLGYTKLAHLGGALHELVMTAAL